MTADPRRIDTLIVTRKDVEIGVLRRIENGWRFDYEEAPHYSVCHSMRHQQSMAFERIGVNLPAFFANLLPEGSRINAVARSIKTSVDDLFSLLIATSGDLIGDVGIANERGIEYSLALHELKQESWADLRGEVQSVAGVQEKMSGRLTAVSVRTRGAPCLVKFDNVAFPNIVENEMFFLGLAKVCGLKVAHAEVISDSAGDKALMVQRFDRTDHGNRKLAQEDGCQLLDLYPGDKYHPTFHDLIRKFTEVCASPRLAALDLIRQYIFSYIIGNGDMHAKNVSILENAKSGLIEVSPAYDLLTTLAYPGLDQNMALAVLGKDSNFRASSFVDLGRRFDIPETVLLKNLHQLCEGVSSRIQHCETIFDPKTAEKVVNEIQRRIQRLS
ncbi:MAG: HipA domain-containing protein [Armatimonadota bacterium]